MCLQMSFLCTVYLFSPAFTYAAAFELGSVLTESFSGRSQPGAYIGWGTGPWHMGLNSAGVATDVYYHSSYKAMVTFQLIHHKSWLGTLAWGVGVGALYSERAYVPDLQYSPPRPPVRSSVVGPGFRAVWLPFRLVFVALDCIYGLNWQALYLGFQEEATLSAGVIIPVG